MLKKIILLLFLIFITTYCVVAEDNQERVITIGAYDDSGFYKVKDGLIIGGYAYDLQTTLNRYLKWNVDYEVNSWSDNLIKVKNHEIDLVFGAFKNNERLKEYEYNSTPIAIVTNYLYGNLKAEAINKEYYRLEGSNIGVTKGSSSTDDFLALMAEEDVKINIVPYDNYSGIKKGMDEGKIDYFLDNTVYVGDNFTVVQKLNTKPMYIMASKGNKNLLDQFDMALERLNYVNPSLTNDLLFKSYKNNNDIYSYLINEDLNFINNMNTLKLGVLNNSLPYYYNDGRDKGAIPGIVDQISSISGLNIELVRFDKEENLIASFKKHDIDLMSGVAHNFYAANKNNYSITMPIYSDELNLILPKDKIYTDHEGTIAILKSNLGYEEEIYELYQDSSIIVYNDINNFLNAIVKGEVEKGVAINFSFIANQDSYPILDKLIITSDSSNQISSSFAVSNELDYRYLEVIDKSINNLNVDLIKADVISSFDYLRQNNSANFIHDNIKSILIIILIIASIILILIIFNFDFRRRNKILDLTNKELEKTKQELIVANEEKNEFLARMSHDMKTPMNAIIALAELGYDDSTDLLNKDYYQQIKSSSTYLMSILNDLLETRVIEIDNLKLAPSLVSLNEVMEDVINVSRFKANSKEITFISKLDLVDDIEYIYLDDKRLKQLLINLIDNAIKYTPKGGEVSWRVATEKFGDKLKVVHVIEDNGYGMSQKFQEKMYESFQRETTLETEKISGTGLGLSRVKAIVDKMDGKIYCQSTLGKGTKFTLTFLRDIASQSEISNLKSKVNKDINSDIFKGKKVLIVEDNEINVKIISKILIKQDFEIVVKRNGLEAVEFLKTRNDIDFCLMDIRMPVMDGLEATREIRKFNEDLVIIALSANAFQSDVEDSLEAGVNAHLAKPLDIQKLLLTLTSFIIA